MLIESMTTDSGGTLGPAGFALAFQTFGLESFFSRLLSGRMRFRGKLVDIGSIQHLFRIISTISKLSKSCVLRITTSNLYFIVSDRIIDGGTQVWCELPQEHFFNEYNMDGISEEDNEMYLILLPDNLLQALKNAQNAKWIKIKLSNRQGPCLIVEVDLPNLSGLPRIVVHYIPVDVVPRRLWKDFDEPEVPQFDVSIAMPSLKQLRNVVDRMKSLSNYVTIKANGSGEMKLMIETEVASVCTHFRDLENPNLRVETDDPDSPSQIHTQSLVKDRNPQEFISANVDIRKLCQFLVSQQLNPSRVFCNIVDHRMIHLLLLHDDVSLQYFIPVVSKG